MTVRPTSTYPGVLWYRRLLLNALSNQLFLVGMVFRSLLMNSVKEKLMFNSLFIVLISSTILPR